MNNDQKTVTDSLLPLFHISSFIQEIIDEHVAFAYESNIMKVNPEMQQLKLTQVAQTQAKKDEIMLEIDKLHKLVTTDALEYLPLASVESNFLQKVNGLRQSLKKLVNI